MKVDINKFIVYGFRNSYNTFGHIQEAWYRALKFKFPYDSVSWVDEQTNPRTIDYENALVLTVNVADLRGLPHRKDIFYVIHNIDDKVKQFFGDISQYSVMNYGMYTSTTQLGDDIEVGFETYLALQPHMPYSSMILRWGTDLFPHEIEENKPTLVFNENSREVNFVGTIYEDVHAPFRQACAENGITFKGLGGSQNGGFPISIQENASLVRQSYMAPAIGDLYHTKVGYIPCRTYKNISYGCLPLTNNRHAQDFFKGRLIFNEDTYQLFYDAREQLRNYKLEDLHQLMDEVAANHTYLTKVDSLLKAVQITQERNAAYLHHNEF
jgi:hypothetical protein